MKLTILSLNIGLLRLAGGLVEPTPHTRLRLGALPEALVRCNADVIALQEIYDQPYRRWLVSMLEEAYPHAAYVRAARPLSLENGLMVLARHRLSADFELFTSAPPEELRFDRKGILSARIQPPQWPVLEILNVHMTAGGLFSHPEAARIDRLRARQIRQLLRRAAAVRGAIPLIVGDLNAGPGVSEGNYRLLEENGYVDVHAWLKGAIDEPTWDPRNPLNARSPHRTSPPQRIDHVFMRRCDLVAETIIPQRSEIVLREPLVFVPGRGRVSVSDHYGLQVEFASERTGL